MDVEQSDREAAATLYRWFNPDLQGAGDGALGGYMDDHPPVQAFAAHRIAATKAALIEVAAVIAQHGNPRSPVEMALILDITLDITQDIRQLIEPQQ